MAATLTLTSQLQVNGQYSSGASGISNSVDQIVSGNNGLILTSPGFTYGNASTFTSNNLQIKDWYSKLISVGASSTVSINLNTGSDTNNFGVALAWTFLKYVLVAVQSPDGVMKVRIGPQGVANSAQLWFGGTTSVCYAEEAFTFQKWSPAAGWTITASTACLFNINNQGASPVSVGVVLGGGS